MKRRNRKLNATENESLPKLIVSTAVAVGLVGLAVYFGFSIWGECRDAGHSILYCMRMVSR